uniref:NADH dehydrogenase subunit 6 n=1 Tax=Eubranchipus grubii TaxID=381661 RepID=A0A7D7FCR8_9CRUS|nr:NADH dehydrogenase subunit 6 [Eubranchipus grubii]QMP96525.1 NADH dehydrogenase subunit 6 [Eubranchipus grubii]
MYVLLIISSSMIFINHPLSFTLCLLLQTTVLCIALVPLSPWISLILFLIFLGGVLVMFLYVASLSANESFMMDSMVMITVATSTIVSLILWSEIKQTPLANKSMSQNMDSVLHPVSSPLYLSLTIYLFLALLLIVEFLNMNKKPLRSLF